MKYGIPKRKVVFQPSIFGGYVSFRECIFLPYFAYVFFANLNICPWRTMKLQVLQHVCALCMFLESACQSKAALSCYFQKGYDCFSHFGLLRTCKLLQHQSNQMQNGHCWFDPFATKTPNMKTTTQHDSKQKHIVTWLTNDMLDSLDYFNVLPLLCAICLQVLPFDRKHTQVHGNFN